MSTKKIKTLLFPARHIVNTKFQENYLFEALTSRSIQFLAKREETERDTAENAPTPRFTLKTLNGSDGSPLQIDRLIFAITSCNQDHSRYTPVPFHVRAVGVDRFARRIREAVPFQIRNIHIFGIPHYSTTPKFASHIIKEIEQQSEGFLDVNTSNTAVVCSTPSLAEMFLDLGFEVLPAELDISRTVHGKDAFMTNTPLSVIKKIVHAASYSKTNGSTESASMESDSWKSDPGVLRFISPATFSLWNEFPDVPKRVIRIWKDPLLTSSGSLTSTRDYATYAYAMSNHHIIELKYSDIRFGIKPGKIVDEGCADGALLRLVARDFSDSDLIGIDITSEFIARCRERQRAGDFGSGTFVHFLQRNITESIFKDSVVDTTICNSTLHELWSYGNQEATVVKYLSLKAKQTRPKGRLVIRDVVGPENGDAHIVMWLNDSDGSNESPLKPCANHTELTQYLNQLSTYGRFLRFVEDFLAEGRQKGKRTPDTKITFTEVNREQLDIDNQSGSLPAHGRFVKLKLRQAQEFMTKKDYTDNWLSELNEEFAFWSFTQWKDALQTAGFQVLENPNDAANSSRAYTSEWIVKQSFEGKVLLFSVSAVSAEGYTVKSMPYPVTNMILVGEKSSS